MAILKPTNLAKHNRGPSLALIKKAEYQLLLERSKTKRFCGLCNDGHDYRRPSNLHRHLKIHLGDADKEALKLRCSRTDPKTGEQCEYSTLEKENLREHERHVHDKVSIHCQLPSLTGSSKICGKAYFGMSSLIRHEKGEHGYHRKQKKNDPPLKKVAKASIHVGSSTKSKNWSSSKESAKEALPAPAPKSKAADTRAERAARRELGNGGGDQSKASQLDSSTGCYNSDLPRVFGPFPPLSFLGPLANTGLKIMENEDVVPINETHCLGENGIALAESYCRFGIPKVLSPEQAHLLEPTNYPLHPVFNWSSAWASSYCSMQTSYCRTRVPGKSTEDDSSDDEEHECDEIFF